MIANAHVLELVDLNESVLQVTLKPLQYINYIAGQYLEIIVGTESFAYSIANAPCIPEVYILHIKHRQDNPIAPRLMQALQGSIIKISAPLGVCHLDMLDPGLPLICVAGGSGIAPIKAILDQLVDSCDSRPVHLFWGARANGDFYLQTSISQWQANLSDFSRLLKLSDIDQAPLISAVLEQAQDLHRSQIVLSGPFDMVYHARDVLIAAGVSSTNLFADAFTFENKGE